MFAYNQPPVLALARILQDLAGESLVDYLRPRLLDPLGIGDFRWRRSSTDHVLGFSGVYTDLDAIARLGQLYLDDGVWNGRRLLPDGWVADASSIHVANPERDEPDWSQGYGFQLWMSRHGYRGDGAFGQYMVVLPEQDAVVAMFSHVEEMQLVLDAMWEHLLPAMFERPMSDTAVVDPAGSISDDALARRLATLSLPKAAEPIGGGPMREVPTTTFRRDGPSHPTVTAIDTSPAWMVIREDADSIELPLTDEWSVVDDSYAVSATSRSDGSIVVDVVILTPHLLEIELDPAARTFTARWPAIPRFRAGLDVRLVEMHPPDR